MELVYADRNREDLSLLRNFNLDLAYGKDENEFQLIIDLDEHCLEEGYWIYIEGTEYGGIVDKIKPSNKNDSVTYIGRTFHGILEGKVLQPDSGNDYLLLDGEANQVLGEIIDLIGLGDVFTVSDADSGIYIDNYEIRYVKTYTGIRKMLGAFGAKLSVKYDGKYVVLSAVEAADYSNDEEWDDSQVHFTATKNYRPVNHLVCLGNGELKNRHVIHLFSDADGVIQSYSNKILPLSDSDYILDTSKQILTGTDEVSEVLDYPNASDVENYVLSDTRPSNWEKVYGNYYTANADGDLFQAKAENVTVYELQKICPYDWSVDFEKYYVKNGSGYSNVTFSDTDVYTVQSSAPGDWNYNYGNYYTKSGSYYSKVSSAENVTYSKLTAKPNDWKNNYNGYYYSPDGVSMSTVQGKANTSYTVQSYKPADWSTNYKNYFVKKKTKYVNVSGSKAPTWKKNKYYTKTTTYSAPTWKKEKYYKKIVTYAAPVWASNTYYTKSVQKYPTWTANTYYTRVEKTVIPEWHAGMYYELKVDHYSELVKKGIERMEECWSSDEIDIDLDFDETYDIGDIVGAVEHITGIYIWQPITKKIVTLTEYTESISYEIGE